MAGAVRLGLIGAGRWGQIYLKHLAELAPRVRVTHLATSKPGHARLAPGATVTPRWQDVVRAECDAVIIATPPATHAEILDACLEAGKPCLVEKPLCLDVTTAERLEERARRAKSLVLVDHIHLFSPAYEELRRRVQDSGEPVRLIISEGLGSTSRSDTPVLWDRGPHDVSLCLDLMGSQPVSVAALAGPPDAEGRPGAVSMRLEFAAEAMAWIHVSQLSPVKCRRLTVLTDTKLYVFDDTAEVPLAVGTSDEPGRLTPVTAIRQGPTLPRVLTYFLDGLAGGDQRRFGLDLAVDVTRVLAEADDAMRTRSRAAS